MTVAASAIWRVRPSGSDTNGGGYDSTSYPGGTDYSQQNSAQATGTHGSATGTTTFTDATALAFTSAMVGNSMFITGGGLTAGYYFVTAFTSSSIVTLDRSPGTGTLATWHVGGGWAGWTNCSSTGPVVPGNTVYFLGSGTPNPSSYTFDYTVSGSAITLAAGSSTVGAITFANDPGTPGYQAPPNTIGGMPVTRVNILSGITVSANNRFVGLWVTAGSLLVAGDVVFKNESTRYAIGEPIWFGCVLDQVGTSVNMIQDVATIVGSEIFSSVAGVGDFNGALVTFSITFIVGCNIHDVVGVGLIIAINCPSITVVGNIFGHCGTDGINLNASNLANGLIINNTIDSSFVRGITIQFQASLSITIMNNIFSNSTNNNGLDVQAGTAVQNSAIAQLFDYNVFYNNLANYGNLNPGPHDTALTATPYVSSSTENYTLA